MANSGNFLAFCGFFLCFLVGVSGLVSHFKLGECMNISQEVGRIASLTLTPYPPKLPGDLTVSGSIHLYQPVKGNVTAKVEIRRKLGFLGYALAIPCISNLGTCTYTDVCALISGKVKTTTAVPTTTTAVPTTTTVVPTSTTAVPTSTTPVPTVTTSVPQTTASVPTQKSASVSDMPVTSRLPSTDSQVTTSTASTGGPVTSTKMATDTLISSTATPITYASVWTSTLGDVSNGNDVRTTEASDPLIGRRDVDGDGDWVAGTDSDIVSNPTVSSRSTSKASEMAVTPLPATKTSQPVQNTVSTAASETSEPVQTTESTAAVTQTQEPVKSTATMTPSSTVSPATETQPPTTSTATMKATDKLVTQSVTDVSKTPSTTSFLQEVSMTTEKYECPAVLADNNIPCRCPFDVGVYTIPPTFFRIPDLGTFSSLAKGDYQVTVSFYDGETDEMLMCQIAEFSLSSGTASTQQECHGLGCIIG
eukprot:GHVL01038254.1.p1 GENE.GHVL01038254.1~~GHVL01038254.1.p1  ORF type:complete len:478 (+),score=31.78 GHVL01038254.1:80-1513(+)